MIVSNNDAILLTISPYGTCFYLLLIQVNIGGQIKNRPNRKEKQSENGWTSQPKIGRAHGFGRSGIWDLQKNKAYSRQNYYSRKPAPWTRVRGTGSRAQADRSACALDPDCCALYPVPWDRVEDSSHFCLVFLICALDPGPWDWVEGPSRPVRLRPRPGSTDPGPGHSLLRISCDGGKERLTKLCAGPGSGGPGRARSQAGLIVLDPVPQNLVQRTNRKHQVKVTCVLNPVQWNRN